MNNKDALRKIYESQLAVSGLSIGADDFINSAVFATMEAEPIYLPMMVKNLPVIFPLDDVLREGKWTDRVAYHPVSESITREVSPVLLSVLEAFKSKVFQSVFVIGSAYLNLAKDSRSGAVKHIPADLAESLTVLPKTIDAKTVAFFYKLVAACNGTDKALVKTCLKRGGDIDGREHKRTMTTYFPLYEELVAAISEKKGELWGVTAARKTDLNAVAEVLKIVLPSIDNPNGYAFGTFAPTAPFLDAYIRGAALVQKDLNLAMDKLDKYIESAKRTMIYADVSWLEEQDDLKQLRNIIPPLRYNEGDLTEEELDEIERKNAKVKQSTVAPRKSKVKEEEVVTFEKEPEPVEAEIVTFDKEVVIDDATPLTIPDFKGKAQAQTVRVNKEQQRSGRIYLDEALTPDERANPKRSYKDLGERPRTETRESNRGSWTERQAERRRQEEDDRYNRGYREDDRQYRDDYHRDDYGRGDRGRRDDYRRDDYRNDDYRRSRRDDYDDRRRDSGRRDDYYEDRRYSGPRR